MNRSAERSLPGILKILAAVVLVLGPTTEWVAAAELTLADLTEAEGDGPDGVGNTADDTWQFWFELAHAPGRFQRLTRHSTSLPAGGIPGKVRGPVAGLLPNPGQTTGWVLHTDWDARFEGVWADSTTREILVHPYVEKTAHQAVAITYRVPASGPYVVSVGLTDMQVDPGHPRHDGILWRLELIEPVAGKTAELGKGGPIGDGEGRSDSAKFRSKATRMRRGYLIRLVIHPNKWWGRDLTRVDFFKIEKK